MWRVNPSNPCSCSPTSSRKRAGNLGTAAKQRVSHAGSSPKA